MTCEEVAETLHTRQCTYLGEQWAGGDHVTPGDTHTVYTRSTKDTAPNTPSRHVRYIQGKPVLVIDAQRVELKVEEVLLELGPVEIGRRIRRVKVPQRIDRNTTAMWKVC